MPARFVPPTTLAAVGSGRKEGHLEGSRIVNIGFVAGQHTAIVTADQMGLAFYHSLSKALFFEASDVLRILRKYPNEETVVPGQAPFHRRRARHTNTILAMAPLPLGTVPNFVFVLFVAIVGLYTHSVVQAVSYMRVVWWQRQSPEHGRAQRPRHRDEREHEPWRERHRHASQHLARRRQWQRLWQHTQCTRGAYTLERNRRRWDGLVDD